MLDNFPELDCKADAEDNPANKTTVVAPGQGKVPTNIQNEKDWDTRGFPCLHPDGQNGLDSVRKVPLTKQQYFEQRILNEDLRFANCPEYVFSAFAAYCIFLFSPILYCISGPVGATDPLFFQLPCIFSVACSLNY